MDEISLCAIIMVVWGVFQTFTRPPEEEEKFVWKEVRGMLEAYVWRYNKIVYLRNEHLYLLARGNYSLEDLVWLQICSNLSSKIEAKFLELLQEQKKSYK